MDNGNLRCRSGFTLIEMAVVLVIIGLLVGGLVVGRSMLTTSRLQGVITDADNYITATTNFRQTYQALPGDMATATSVWTTAGITSNGNGDGTIGDNATTTSGQEFESFRFWQHLYLAGMFSQNLTGTATSGNYTGTIGTDLPAGRLDGSGYFMIWKGTVSSGDTNYLCGSTSSCTSQFYGHVLMLGSTSTGYGTSGAVMTADQASSIDAKIDDGVPGTGKLRAFGPNASSYTPNCTVTTSNTYYYNVAGSGNTCSLLFITGF